MGNIRISKIELHQMGPFGDLTLDFPEKLPGMERKAEVHILTGENGTGKTTVLEMLAAGFGPFISQGLQSKRRKKNEATTLGQLHINYLNEKSISSIPFSGVSSENIAPRVFFIDYPTKPYPFACFAYSGYRRVDHVQISGIQEQEIDPMKGALQFNQTGDPNAILQWIANTIAGEAIATTQNEPEEAAQRRTALSSIEEAIARIINKKIAFRLQTKPYAVKVEVDGEILDFNALPDGMRSIISWLSDLLMRMDRVKWEHDTPVFERNFILFLDEIEVHLHPAWQRKILPVVQGLFPNAQSFITTHSPFVVGSVDGAWIHKLEKPNGDSRLAAGYPMLSEDAKSYRYWLEEVFDVKSEYGEEADRDLKEFYVIRDEVLAGGNGTAQESLRQKAQKLAIQSPEIQQIIEMEFRQINRRLNLQLSL